MVKLDDLPEEQPRVELDKLADFMKANGYVVPLIALTEKWQEASENKTGGLNITLWTGINFISLYDTNTKAFVEEENAVTYPEGLQLTQKYSKISGRALKESLEEMGIGDTEELQKGFFNYELKPFRTGFPRLIPVSRSDKEFEELPEE